MTDTVTVEIELDPGRSYHYEELQEEFGDLIDGQLEDVVKNEITKMYDRQDEIRRQVEQAQ